MFQFSILQQCSLFHLWAYCATVLQFRSSCSGERAKDARDGEFGELWRRWSLTTGQSSWWGQCRWQQRQIWRWWCLTIIELIENPDDYPGVGAEKISTQGTQWVDHWDYWRLGNNLISHSTLWICCWNDVKSRSHMQIQMFMLSHLEDREGQQ